MPLTAPALQHRAQLGTDAWEVAFVAYAMLELSALRTACLRRAPPASFASREQRRKLHAREGLVARRVLARLFNALAARIAPLDRLSHRHARLAATVPMARVRQPSVLQAIIASLTPVLLLRVLRVSLVLLQA